MAGKVLVTGGLGLIGRHLVAELVKKGYEVSVLDNFYHNQKLDEFEFMDKIKMITGDVRDLNMVQEASKVDIIFHLAALSNIRESIENPEYCFSTNVNGTFNVLTSAVKNKVKKVIFSSSREVYGNPQSLPVNENAPLNPVNLYGISKVCDEQLCALFRKQHGLNITIFRISNAYGPNDPGKSRVIPSFLRKIKSHQDLEINGGNQVLDFVWIGDVIRVLLDSIGHYDNETLNIGSGNGTTINEIAKLLLSLAGSKSGINYKPGISLEVGKYVADISRIGIKPVALKDGLTELLKKELF